MENTRFKISQYACAVLLIVSSIALVAYQVVMIDDVSNGLLVYVAQAFLLVAFLKACEYTDQLLTASSWLHISWNPFAPPRHFVWVGYYK